MTRRRAQVLTRGGVIASMVQVVLGVGMIALAAAAVIDTGAHDPLEIVGIARPAPYLWFLAAAVLLALAGFFFIGAGGRYLRRAARGELRRPGGDPALRRDPRRSGDPRRRARGARRS